MTDKITVEEAIRSNWLGVCFMTLLGDNHELVPPANNQVPFDVNVTINGKEVSFRDLIQHLESCYETCVNESASKMLLDKFQDMRDHLDFAERNLKNQLHKAGLNQEIDW